MSVTQKDLDKAYDAGWRGGSVDTRNLSTEDRNKIDDMVNRGRQGLPQQ